MENPRAEKVAVVDEVQAKLADAEAAILTEYRGLNVTQLSNLRRQLRESGTEYKIYKNTLVRFAARNLEVDLEDLLTGPTAIAFVGDAGNGTRGDPVAAAKTLRSFGRELPVLVMKGGLLGNRTITAEEARALAEMPPRDQVLAEIAGLLQAPLGALASLVDAVPRDIAYALQALVDKGDGESDAAAGAPSDAAEAAEEEPSIAPSDDDAASAEAGAEDAPSAAADASATSDDDG